MALVVTRSGSWSLQIVRRTQPPVSRSCPNDAWTSRNRRLARDFERYATTVAAFIRLAMIRIMLRRLCRNHFAMNPNFPDGLLVAARLPAHILQKPAHRVELRAEARPVSGF